MNPNNSNDILAIVKKHLLSIICIISIIALFLPFASVTVESDFISTTNSASGFDIAKEGFLGYLLFLAPIILIVMNYVKQLEKYRGIISLAVPPICIIVLIIVFFQAKKAAVDVDIFLIDVYTKVGFGAILAAICYIAMWIVGAKTHGAEILKRANITDIKYIGTKNSGSLKSTDTPAETSSTTEKMKKEDSFTHE